MTNYKELLKKIDTFIFDYDGVLTEGIVMLTDAGEPLRTANVRDGYALQLAVKKGYRVAVISGGKSPSMYHRMNSLGIKDVFLGVEHKIEVFEKYLADNNIDPDTVIYMGDDIPDFPVMKLIRRLPRRSNERSAWTRGSDLQIPADAESTQLLSSPPSYWDLELRSKGRGGKLKHPLQVVRITRHLEARVLGRAAHGKLIHVRPSHEHRSRFA